MRSTVDGRRFMLGVVIFAAVTAAALALGPGDDDDTADPFSQDTFPCAEDELLGYAPGEDDLVCIHHEDV